MTQQSLIGICIHIDTCMHMSFKETQRHMQSHSDVKTETEASQPYQGHLVHRLDSRPASDTEYKPDSHK